MNNAKRLWAVLLAVALILMFIPGLSAEEAPKINVNKATVEQLSQLKRIGAKYAERIIQYRQTHGAFKRVEDLAKVPGIGPKTIEANKDILTVE